MRQQRLADVNQDNQQQSVNEEEDKEPILANLMPVQASQGGQVVGQTFWLDEEAFIPETSFENCNQMQEMPEYVVQFCEGRLKKNFFVLKMNISANCEAQIINTASTTEETTTSSNAYRHIPHREKPPHLVARRNARERRRVHAVNLAFVRLRRAVPFENKVI